MPPVLLLLLAVVAVFGMALRIVHPTHAFYWNDEVWTALQATGHSYAEVERFLSPPQTITAGDLVALQEYDPTAKFGIFLKSDPHTSPLFYALCWAAIRLTSDHVLGTRALSGVLACLALGATFWAALEIFRSKAVAWVALAIAAVSPTQLYIAYEARPYGLWLATTAIATAAFVRAFRVDRPNLWAWYAASGALLLYSHLYGVFTIAGHAVYVATSPATTRASLLRFLRALGMVAVLAAPWVLSIAARLNAVRALTGWLTRPIPLAEEIDFMKSALLWQFDTYEALPPFALARPLLVGLIGGVYALSMIALWRRRPREVAASLTVVVFSLPLFLFLFDALAGGRRFGVSRYYVASWFGLTIVLAWFTVEQAKRAFAGLRLVNLFAASWIVAVGGLVAISARAAGGMFRARLPEGKPDACLSAAADAIAHSERPIILNPALVSSPLILSGALPPQTSIINMREAARPQGPELKRLAHDHAVFLLRFQGSYYEPRPYEAAHLEREIRSNFRLEPSGPSACASRILPLDESP